MNSTFKILAAVSAFAAVPAWAAEPDGHVDHHPAGAAAPVPKADTTPGPAQGCQMMNGQMMNGQMMRGQAPMTGGASGQGMPKGMSGPQMSGPQGMAPMGGMPMMNGKGMPCMNNPPAQSAPGPGDQHSDHAPPPAAK